MEKNNSGVGAVLGIYNKLSVQQRLIIGGIIAATLLLFTFIIFLFNEPDYTTLYSNLAPEDASRVIEALNGQKIPYKIDDDGRTVRIPKEHVYEQRLSLASKGIPSAGIIGYEIFDKSSLGMSEFMQKLNLKRALEGEIARTIMKQEGIDGARVHIVFPAKTLFREEEKSPTASIVLQVRGGFRLTENNINAISHLVSSSVEGLDPEKVTILDTRGRLLSKETGEKTAFKSGTLQYEIKQSIENYLVSKAQTILDNVLGYGNSIVQIDAELNFDQVEKTMELFDPETQVVVSEQTVKSENTGSSYSDSSAQFTENSTTNYEISKTVQRVIEGTGNINRLSIAAVINDVRREVVTGDAAEIVYEPRSTEQMNKLEEIIKKAVGVDERRNDQFSIVNIPFETPKYDTEEIHEASPFGGFENWTNILLVFVAVGASIFLLKSLLTRLKNERIVVGTLNVDGYDSHGFDGIDPVEREIHTIQQKKKRNILPVGDIEDEITDEAIQKKRQHEKISTYVAKNPSEAARLINTWLLDEQN